MYAGMPYGFEFQLSCVTLGKLPILFKPVSSSEEKKICSHRAIVRVPQNRASRHLAKCAQHRLAAWHGWVYLDLITKSIFLSPFHNAFMQSFLSHFLLHTKAGCLEQQWVSRD